MPSGKNDHQKLKNMMHVAASNCIYIDIHRGWEGLKVPTFAISSTPSTGGVVEGITSGSFLSPSAMHKSNSSQLLVELGFEHPKG